MLFRSHNKFMYKLVLFDFDGTIANTLDAGIPLFNEFARKYGFLEIRDKEEVRGFSLNQFIKNHRMSRTKFIFYFKKFLKRLNSKMDKVKPYDGITDVFKELKINYRMAILSTNSKENIVRFLNRNNLLFYFEFIENYSLLLGKSNKIKRIMRKMNLKKNEVVYIGDDIRDIKASQKSGIDIIAVTWGFHKKEILKEKNPTFIAEKPQDIIKFLKL